MRLAELQRAFWTAVRTRGSPPPDIDALCTRSERQSARERLAVYHRAYWHRQLAALNNTFARTRALLPDRFERLVFGYIERHPSTEPCIERLGSSFPEFLAQRADVPSYVLDVARLEWATTETLLARSPRAVQALPRHLGAGFAECRLDFVPSLRVAHVSRAALAWFDSEEREASALVDSAPIDVAFYRPEHTVRHVTLEADEARAHALASGGSSIALICTAFSDLAQEQAATRALSVLANWFARAWVERCEP